MKTDRGKSSRFPILFLSGDGIGPEIVAATERVLREVDRIYGLGLEFNHGTIGFDALREFGTTFPNGVAEAAAKAAGIVLGPVSHNDYPPVKEGGLNPSGELRRRLDLYANIRPAKHYPSLQRAIDRDIDLVIVRENTEGFYSDRSMFVGPGEFMPTSDLALSVRKVTRASSLRIAESGFSLAGQRRRKVTVVHKANVLRVSDGLFLECTRAVAAKFPSIEYQECLVDSMAALLVRDPSRFDVIVTTNMFGDILSDQASEIAGGLGLAASLNAGSAYAMAQAQHGSAPDIAGRDLANPVSLIGSAAMLLNWLSERHGRKKFLAAGIAIGRALETVIGNPMQRTHDMGGDNGTRAFTGFVVDALKAAKKVAA
jgi:3-isopropylmalate dehydrogenase